MEETVGNHPMPSAEVMLDLKAAIEKLIDPENELEAVLVLALARRPDGDVENRVYTVPPVETNRLLEAMREYLEGPPGLAYYETS
jgi:hypothetical protein